MDRERAGQQGLTAAALPLSMPLGRPAQGSRFPFPFVFFGVFPGVAFRCRAGQPTCASM